MDLGEEFGFEQKLADEGTWIPVGENGTRLKVAAWPNRKHQEFMEPVYRRLRGLDKMPPEEVFEESMAKFCLLDWEGIEDGGAPVEATEENRRAMLHKYPRFKALVLAEAGNIKNFRAQSEEAETKN
jgi:hypothetical protein